MRVWALTTQTAMFDERSQMMLCDGRTAHFPGFDTPVNPVIASEPKIKTPIEGPAARAARGNRKLQFGGLRGPEEPERSGGGISRREIITSRQRLLPFFFKSPERLEGIEEAKIKSNEAYKALLHSP